MIVLKFPQDGYPVFVTMNKKRMMLANELELNVFACSREGVAYPVYTVSHGQTILDFQSKRG